MTASTVIPVATSTSPARLSGLSALVRKEWTEWLRGRRAWVVLIVTTIFMVLTALATWINVSLRESFPADDAVDLGPVSLDPVGNLAGAITSQFFILAVVFAVAGLVVRERETGTLAWVASKPVRRSSIYLGKWIAASVMLGVVAVILPTIVTVATIIPTYGTPDPIVVLALIVGMVATTVFYAAAVLTLGTMLSSQTAVAAAGLGLVALPLLVGAIPLPLAQFLPQSILTWFAALVSGSPVSIATPVAYVLVTAGIVVYGMHRLERLEL